MFAIHLNTFLISLYYNMHFINLIYDKFNNYFQCTIIVRSFLKSIIIKVIKIITESAIHVATSALNVSASKFSI